MKALTVKQPFASMIASGWKRVECRSWPVPKSIRGQRIAIHAGKGYDEDGWSEDVGSMCLAWCQCGLGVCDACRLNDWLEPQDSRLVAGRILATARVIGQLAPGGRWLEEAEWWEVDPCINCDSTGIVDNDPCAWCWGTGNLHAGDVDTLNWGAGHLDEYRWILRDVELVSDETIRRGKLGLWEVETQENK